MTNTRRDRPLRRPSSWLAIAILVLIIGAVAASLAQLVSSEAEGIPDRPDALNVATVLFAVLALPTVGAILATLRPGNPIGWLFLVSGLGLTASIFAEEYVGRSVYTGADLPFAQVIDWIGAWANWLGIGIALVFLPLLFPDGRPPGRWWRVYGWIAAIALAVSGLASMLAPDAASGYVGRLPNPIGVHGPIGQAAAFVMQLQPLLLILAPLSFASLAIRFRRSRGIERQQLKWFFWAGTAFLVTALIGFTTSAQIVWYGVLVAFGALPVAAGIAVLRYRLYEIDRIISRTVSYAIVTATLVVVFVTVILGLQAVLAPVTQNNTVAVAASTLVVAALFQPLRRRVQHAVDRRFDRARYDGQRLSDEFAKQLRDEVDLERLRAALLQTTDQAVRPTGSRLWLRAPTEGRG